jgi:hypothetical protein
LVADFTDVPRKIAEAIRDGAVTAFRTVVRLGGAFGKALKSIGLRGLLPPADLADVANLFAAQYAATDEVRIYTLPPRSTAHAGLYRQETTMANDGKHATTKLAEAIKIYQAAHPEFRGKDSEVMAILRPLPEYQQLFIDYLNERMQ